MRPLLLIALLTASAARADVAGEFVELREVEVSGEGEAAGAPVPFYRARSDADLFWLRGRLELGEEPALAGRPLGVRLMALASCELFWDGVLLGSNGRVAARASAEKPGEIDWIVPLPASLASAGEHRVALRCSAHHRGFEPYAGFYGLWVGDWLALHEAGRGRAARTLLSAGGLIAIGLFYGLVFLLADRSPPHLLLGLLALAAGAWVIVESLRDLVGYTYDLHYWRLVAITALVWIVGFLLLAFVTSRFPASGDRVFLAAATGLMSLGLVPQAFDFKAALMISVASAASLAWALRALRSRRPGSGFAAAGLTLCCGVAALSLALGFLDSSLFFALTALCLFLLASHVLAGARERRERQALELRAARLEIELLRRHLQPHFLMNSLTALSEWFEEEPEVAGEMMEDLGEEMRLLAEISRHRAIPLSRELELCRAHLAVMARRLDLALELDAEGVDESLTVPPAIFHTLIENALTHNRYGRGRVRFSLRQERVPGRVRYVFDAPLGPRGPRPARSSGTGMRYIEARLQERYGEGAYRLKCGAREDRDGGGVWRTTLDLPVAALRGPSRSPLLGRGAEVQRA